MCKFNRHQLDFDVINKSCYFHPNGTIPYDPLCTGLLRIKATSLPKAIEDVLKMSLP